MKREKGKPRERNIEQTKEGQEEKINEKKCFNGFGKGRRGQAGSPKRTHRRGSNKGGNGEAGGHVKRKLRHMNKLEGLLKGEKGEKHPRRKRDKELRNFTGESQRGSGH